jgi:hypothetical protein
MQPNAGTLQSLLWHFQHVAAILLAMFTKPKTVLLSIVILASTIAFNQNASVPRSPQYTSDGQMKLPEQYREWVYLTTGFDMSYNPALQMSDHHMFDNVFVNPEAYKAFVETGTWPDKTMLLLEARGAEGKGSINQKGNYQGTDVMAIEVHVKDDARFPGKWAHYPPTVIAATPSMGLWIRRLCSSIPRFFRLRNRRALSQRPIRRRLAHRNSGDI